MIPFINILVLSTVQNIAFTILSRSRNRDNIYYHAVASIVANTLYFLIFRELVLSEMGIDLLLAYILGTTIGSIGGGKFSMWFEQIIGATADGNHKSKPDKVEPSYTKAVEYIKKIEDEAILEELSKMHKADVPLFTAKDVLDNTIKIGNWVGEIHEHDGTMEWYNLDMNVAVYATPHWDTVGETPIEVRYDDYIDERISTVLYVNNVDEYIKEMTEILKNVEKVYGA